MKYFSQFKVEILSGYEVIAVLFCDVDTRELFYREYGNTGQVVCEENKKLNSKNIAELLKYININKFNENNKLENTEVEPGPFSIVFVGNISRDKKLEIFEDSLPENILEMPIEEFLRFSVHKKNADFKEYNYSCNSSVRELCKHLSETTINKEKGIIFRYL